MDSLTFMKCISKTGVSYFTLGEYEERIKNRGKARNDIEDDILEQIDNERKVKLLKEQMTEKQRTVAHLIEIGIKKKFGKIGYKIGK